MKEELNDIITNKPLKGTKIKKIKKYLKGLTGAEISAIISAIVALSSAIDGVANNITVV